MSDIIYGVVESVLDVDAFTLAITHEDEGNKNKYEHNERVQVLDVYQSDPEQDSGEIDSVEVLSNLLEDRNVVCYVKSRNSDNCILADVEIS